MAGGAAATRVLDELSGGRAVRVRNSVKYKFKVTRAEKERDCAKKVAWGEK
jgi:hypothetical protein